MKTNHSKAASAVIFALLFILAAASANAQTTSIQADDRYTAWQKASRVTVVWPNEPPDLGSCAALEPYEPHFTNLFRFVPIGIKFRVQDYNECTWTLAGHDWGYKLRPKGTKVAVDSQGRDMFDLGPEDGDGKVCGNPRPVNIPIIPPPLQPTPVPVVIPPPQPAAVPPEPTPAQAGCEIRPAMATAKAGDSVTFEAFVKGNAGNAVGTWYREDWEEIGQGEAYTFKADKSSSFAFRFTDDFGRRTVCRASVEVGQPVVETTTEIVELGYCDADNEHHWYGFPRVQVQCHPVRTAIIVCGGTAIASAITHVPVPPCGWFKRKMNPSPAAGPVKIPVCVTTTLPDGIKTTSCSP